MKKRDIQTLKKLLAVKQQAASLKYKQRKTERQELLDEAARCLQESYRLHTDADGVVTAGDLIMANRFRKNLRERSTILTAAAGSLDELVDNLRIKTCEAINRESAIEKLAVKSEKQDRADTNNRDESAREQRVILSR